MGRLAFVFAGQGAQAPGMGLSLYANSAAARQIFAWADAIRPGTSQQCFASTEEELKQTVNTQPCLFVVEMAAAAALAEAGLRAELTAGFSLGELSALCYAKAFDFETGLRLVMRRAELMQRASEEQDTAMAAVVKLTNERLEEICTQFAQVYPVNYNCPGQVSVSCAAGELAAFSAAVKAAGGRALPIKVSGAFHSPFMSGAAADFAAELEKIDFEQTAIPVYANRTGEAYGAYIRATLAEQMDHPVLWEKTLRGMIAAGADTFLELGPGRTLCGFIKKTDASVRSFGAAGWEELKTILTEVGAC